MPPLTGPPRAVSGDTLCLDLVSDLAVDGRAATALRMEALVLAHRPGRVHVRVTPGQPSPAALSAVARLRRLCETLGVPLTLAPDAPPAPAALVTADTGQGAQAGASP
ncbi:hypothetical protein ACFQ8C_09575 [Streptomyces sp. NPDC056503]|uniref:hypothetical protein n=1 Tax=Streptomyces sp. NPDC056503 TaxID=3345842 RepID=UPI00368F47B7